MIPTVEVTLTPKAPLEPLVLVDLSSLLHAVWHVSGAEMLTNPNHVSQATVARVRDLTSGTGPAAVCCDSGRSWRNDLSSDYKANRAEKDAALIHQMRQAEDTLRADGLAVWSAPGFEADDIIATATAHAKAEGRPVVIVTQDKDMTQLIDDAAGIALKNIKSGNLMDEAGVSAKFGVMPFQMGDYLALIGDASDNIAGAKGIGPVGAVNLLTTFGTLDAIYERMGTVTLKPSVVKSLTEGKDAILLGRKLIELSTDAPIAYDEALTRRVPESTVTFTEEDMDQIDEAMPTIAKEGQLPLMNDTPDGMYRSLAQSQAPAAIALAPQLPQVLTVSEWEGLEPRNMKAAHEYAKAAFAARLFGAYGNAEAVLMTILAGRELGLSSMASLRSFYVIEGKPSLSASAMVGILLKSKHVNYFRCIERTPERATFEAQRGDDPPLRLSYTIEEARKAWTKDEAAWNKSGWSKHTSDMLVARASSKLARLIAPDVLSGLYDPDELRDAS